MTKRRAFQRCAATCPTQLSAPAAFPRRIKVCRRDQGMKAGENIAACCRRKLWPESEQSCKEASSLSNTKGVMALLHYGEESVS